MYSNETIHCNQQSTFTQKHKAHNETALTEVVPKCRIENAGKLNMI